MIPHKLRKYRSILDLLFELMLAGHRLSSANDATKKMSPMEAMEKIGSVLPRLIEALVYAPVEGGDIQMIKLDIKEGFWRMVCAKGQECNFTYVFPNHPDKPIKLVVPSALQMGWFLSPPFFCAESETARGVEESYVA